MRAALVPTRTELLRLRRRRELARRGHGLLEEKLKGLVGRFLPLAREVRRLRTELDGELPAALAAFRLAGAEAGGEVLERALRPLEGSGALVPALPEGPGAGAPCLALELGGEPDAYSLVETPPELDRGVAALRALAPRLLRLACLEGSLRRLAAEIERTRRRVNSLEHVVIPALEAGERTISGKLEELERGDRARLLRAGAGGLG